uniref:RING-type E3 ubiquitin transferase n=1 Tax=Kalanchoe fedtschenkoi TaxID=63787 RepID=A0A7N0V036_KALFE
MERMSVARLVEGRDDGVAVEELMEVIEAVGGYGAFRRTQKKECLNLVRKLTLLTPLLEEVRDGETASLGGRELRSLGSLKKALLSAKKLLKYCNYGSKIWLALETEAIMCRFHSVYDKLSQALEDLPCEEMGISVEVVEQVELLRTQLKRAKRRTDTQDIELAMDMMVLFSKRDHDASADSAILERLASKLGLRTLAELKAETLAVRKLLKERNGHNSESTQRTVHILGEFKRIAGLESPNALDLPAQSKSFQRCPSLIIPDEFLCPITLEIMTDPVIVATGQTYERESIQKWLDANHRTCPKTGQVLAHVSLAPNYAIRNLILQWCEANSYELPKREACVVSDSTTTELKQEISSLVQGLSTCHIDGKRKAISKLRKLSKENPENRVVIANCGGIPPLVKHLSHPESKIQEETVTALLNLSINEANKRLIGAEGAIPGIIKILQTGTTPEARENSAAALFSLSMLDENKEMIGSAKGVPPLVALLKHGSPRGKKDAATALFNLSLSQANKSRAVRAGIIPPLLRILKDKSLNMVDEALSILLLLASHPEGLREMGTLPFIENLVAIIRDGTPKNKECATSLLLALGLNNSSLTLAALQYGVYDHLMEIRSSGTNRAQRKASSLLQHMSNCEHIP